MANARFEFEDRGFETPCRIWQGGRRGSLGYGCRRRGGVLRYTHRDEWERVNGPVSDGLFVLHRCDEPACAEISHLFLGTQLDNVRDAVAKGRQVDPPVLRGAEHPGAKLTAEQVAEIRASPESGLALARRFGVTNGAISQIRTGKTWREAA